MPWEVGSTVLIAKVNMLTKSVPVTVVRCFFLIDGGETFTTIGGFGSGPKMIGIALVNTDIVYVLDNRMKIVEEIAIDNIEIRKFIREQLQIIMQKGLMQEILMAHIHPLMLAERLPIVEDKIAQIIS